MSNAVREVILLVSILITIAIIFGVAWDSECSKRIELEQALFRCVEDMDEIAESLGVEPILVDAFNRQYRPDSLLAVPPKDTSVLDTIKIIYTFEVGANGKMKQINPPVDSSEVRE